MLDAAVAASGMAPLLDAVLSVDAVRMYKPRREVYALATTRFALRPQEIAFVSSNRWDVMGAAAFGIRPLWVNRARIPDEYAEHPPLRTVPDLSAVASMEF
jgi:2-haloacid dehalogenase